MKNFVLLISGALVATGAFYVLSLARPANAVVAPVECTGMAFDHVIVGSNFGSVLNGTNGRDLIIGVGGDVIKGNGGADCIVSGGLSLIKAGTGADVVVGANGDSIKGEGGNDSLYGGFGTKLDGGTGTDTCSSDAFSGKEVNCEL